MKWYNIHPLKHDKSAYLFISKRNNQLKPVVINNILKSACKNLGIRKPVTCYSFKRNGVTFSRLRGESDVEIQHKARWTSTKQLKTYDLSTQEDSFKKALAKRGLLNQDNFIDYQPESKKCRFCGYDKIGFSEDICPQCLHIINQEKIKKYIKAEQSLNDFMSPEVQMLFKLVYKLQYEINEIKNKGTLNKEKILYIE